MNPTNPDNRDDGASLGELAGVVAGLLRAAAERIARCGLHRGEYWPVLPDGEPAYIDGDPCCALGALAVAAGIDDAQRADRAYDRRLELVAAADALAAQLSGWSSVPAWNDHPGRTTAEVVTALRAAADRLHPGRPDPDPDSAWSGGPSAKTSHHPGPDSTANNTATSTANHQDDSKHDREEARRDRAA